MKKIALLKGDGIGPEIMEQGVKVLKTIEEMTSLSFTFSQGLIGGEAIDKRGNPFPKETKDLCTCSDAVLLGAVGGPKWDSIDPKLRPEKGLLNLRSSLELYSNLRPIKMLSPLMEYSPLKGEIIKGVDILIVRELVGGIYFGKRERGRDNRGLRFAYDVEYYNEEEIKRISHVAFRSALGRRRKVTLVDKANVLDSSKLWREVVTEVQKDYPLVELEFMYVDNCSMQLIKNPGNFDVILTSNLFGDILSDEASVLTGSIGMLPSASMGESGIHVYEPIHGSAPDLAGKGLANPLGMILSIAMMLRYSFQREREAELIEDAVEELLQRGLFPKDLCKEGRSTWEIGEDICEIIKSKAQL